MPDVITRNSSPTVNLPGLRLVQGDADAGMQTETVVHKKLNGSGHMVAFRPARDRAGSLRVLFDTAADAWASAVLLRTEYTFALSSVEPEMDMTFVVAGGRIVPRLGEGGEEWIIDVPFVEVDPA